MVRVLLCCALFALAACSKPQPPDKERPVEPQATGQAKGVLNEAIQAPMDKAKRVEEAVQQGQQAQDAAIEAAGG